MKKILVGLMGAFVLCFLCFSASGGSESELVIRDISPFVLGRTADYLVNGFFETNEGWDSDDETVDVTLSEKISSFPYAPLTDGGNLVVRKVDAMSGQRNYIEKTFSDQLDLSQYSFIVLAVNCASVPDADYRIRVEMYSDGDSFVFNGMLFDQSWSAVFVDVSQWEGRSTVNKMRISVAFNSKTVEKGAFEYYIDSISLVASSADANVAAFGAASYSAEGGFSDGGNNKLSYSGVADELTLSSEGFAYGVLGGASGLRIDFSSEGSCNGVTLLTKRGDGEYVEEAYSDVWLFNGAGSVFLPINGDGVDEIKIIFEGVRMGRVEVFSVSPASFCSEYSNDAVRIDSCVINSGTSELIVRGRVMGVDAVGAELLLFSSDYCDDFTLEDGARNDPLGKTEALSDNFIFRISYSSLAEGRDLLYKKYSVVMRRDGDSVAVSSPKCVTNPESLCVDGAVPARTKNGKGLIGTGISFMQEVGASDTALWVDVGEFFAPDSNGGGKFEIDGYVYYYNAAYFSDIDTAIGNFAEKNIDVTLVFVVSDTGSDALNKILLHKNADTDAGFCAYNTEDRVGLAYLRAITEFFASEYCTDMTVCRVVFGDSVTLCGEKYNMGGAPLAEFVASYADGLRTVYNAVRSYSPYVGVYTFTDDGWNRRLPFDLTVRFDGLAFLASLDSRISAYGDFDWGFARDPYPENVVDYSSYGDMSDGEGFFVDRAGMGRTDTVSSFFACPKMMYNNTSRDHIIIERTNISSMSEEEATANYVYNCYVALNSGVSAYITDRSSNFNDAMKYVDTNYSMTACSFVSEILGVATWESVINGFSVNKIIKRNVNVGGIGFTEPPARGRLMLSTFANGTAGWKRYGFTERLTAGAVFSGRRELLSLTLGNVSEGEARGILKTYSTPVDLSRSPIVHFGINVASLPTNVNYANITVVATSGQDRFEVSGRIKEAIWTEVYCDFSSFSGVGKVDSLQILFYADENYYDSPQALISPIEVLSLEYTDDELLQMSNPLASETEILRRIRKVAYPILAAVVVVALIVFIRRRTVKLK